MFGRPRPPALWLVACGVGALCAVHVGCGAKSEPQAPVGISAPRGSDGLPEGPVTFAFDPLDVDQPLDSTSTRGKPTVLAFITTYDGLSQAQVNFLLAMAKNDGAEVNYGLVALQERRDLVLVDVYRRGLGVTFPVALADPATLAGHGPFGDVRLLPTVIVLDRRGRVVFRRSQLAKSDELRAALRAAQK